MSLELKVTIKDDVSEQMCETMKGIKNSNDSSQIQQQENLSK